MNRPYKWTIDKQLLIHPNTYRLGWIHRFVCGMLRGEGDVQKFILKQDLMKLTGLAGICLFDEHLIFIADDIDIEEKYISVLHEIFHHYFRDFDDERSREQSMRDPVEYRAENSAINMLQWYLKKPKQFSEFLELYATIKIEFLTDDEIENIIY